MLHFGELKHTSMATLGVQVVLYAAASLCIPTRIMNQTRGANTPWRSDHHKQHAPWFATCNQSPAAPEAQNKDSDLEKKGKSKLHSGTPWMSSALWFTGEMKQLGGFYARSPSVLEECLCACL